MFFTDTAQSVYLIHSYIVILQYCIVVLILTLAWLNYFMQQPAITSKLKGIEGKVSRKMLPICFFTRQSGVFTIKSIFSGSGAPCMEGHSYVNSINPVFELMDKWPAISRVHFDVLLHLLLLYRHLLILLQYFNSNLFFVHLILQRFFGGNSIAGFPHKYTLLRRGISGFKLRDSVSTFLYIDGVCFCVCHKIPIFG